MEEKVVVVGSCEGVRLDVEERCWYRSCVIDLSLNKKQTQKKDLLNTFSSSDCPHHCHNHQSQFFVWSLAFWKRHCCPNPTRVDVASVVRRKQCAFYIGIMGTCIK
jgi:hypothetical protein